MHTNRHDPHEARLVWPPEPGFFRVRLVRGAWAVPAQILRTADGCWQAIVDGVASPPNADPAFAENVARIWESGWRSDETEYRWLNALRDQVAANGPEDHPALHPRRAISHMRLTPLIPRTP